MRTVELLGDEELDRTVRVAWRRLDQAGFSSLLPGQVALAAQAVGEVGAGGTLAGARSYDSVTRTVLPLP